MYFFDFETSKYHPGEYSFVEFHATLFGSSKNFNERIFSGQQSSKQANSFGKLVGRHKKWQPLPFRHLVNMKTLSTQCYNRLLPVLVVPQVTQHHPTPFWRVKPDGMTSKMAKYVTQFVE
jgi:hypothetical protein